jgi:hypothetical protein
VWYNECLYELKSSKWKTQLLDANQGSIEFGAVGTSSHLKVVRLTNTEGKIEISNNSNSKQCYILEDLFKMKWLWEGIEKDHKHLADGKSLRVYLANPENLILNSV